jgi:hypothetical protein
MKKTVILLTIIGLFLSGYSLAQDYISPPETLEEAKEMGKGALQTTLEKLPQILKETWQENVLPVWQKMWDWFKVNIWERIEPRLTGEAEKRKEIIGEEFGKEKEEVKEELPGVTQSLWQRFLELIK